MIYKIIITVLIFNLFLGCGPEMYRPQYRFNLKNGLNVPINLKFYLFNGALVNEEPVQIDPGSTFENEKIETDIDIFELSDPVLPGGFYASSRIELIYNNEAKISVSYEVLSNNPLNVVFSDPKERNLFRAKNYVPIGNNTYLFTINQQDFDNATPCDGPCE